MDSSTYESHQASTRPTQGSRIQESKHIHPSIPYYVPAINNIQEAVAGTQEWTFTVKFRG